MSEEQAPPPNVDDPGPGAMLARARAERQLGILEVAEHLKYGVRQIEALEADDYGRLPGTTFVRGMIRGYAKLVGMDPALALKALDRRHIPAQATVDLRTQRVPFPEGNKRATRLYVALSVIALLVIAAVLYEWHFAQAPTAPVTTALPAPRPAQEAAVAVPVAPVQNQADAAPAAEPGAVPAGRPTDRGRGRRIQFEFLRESWVEVKDRDERILLSQLNPGGTRKAVEGSPPFSVIIGNAAHVRVTYKDAPVDLKPYVKIEVARLTLE
jgi:cytoskeleton protein RodZ